MISTLSTISRMSAVNRPRVLRPSSRQHSTALQEVEAPAQQVAPVGRRDRPRRGNTLQLLQGRRSHPGQQESMVFRCLCFYGSRRIFLEYDVLKMFSNILFVF